MFKAKLIGFDKLGKNLKKFRDKLLENMLDVLIDTTLEIVRKSKQKAPVDTGTLRRSITYRIDKDDLKSYIGTNLVYAAPLEYGAKIKPVKAEKLWIPIGDTKKEVKKFGSVKRYIQSVIKAGGTVVKSKNKENIRLVILDGKVIGAFVLADEVEIEAFKYFEQAFKEVYPKFKEAIKEILKF
jgi:hypothetical protein